MSFDKSELMHRADDEKRQIAFELLDSIDEEFVKKEIPSWKKELVRQRLKQDKENPAEALSWLELKRVIKH